MNRYTTRSRDDETPKTTRRDFLQASVTRAAGAVTLPAVFTVPLIAGVPASAAGDVGLSPRYFPVENFVPDIDLAGKVAIVTGASRGIGKATAEALFARGVEVLGTSRNPRLVPNRPPYPLLTLDITEPESVHHFVEAVAGKLYGRKLDILINNAGRFVLGSILPTQPQRPSPPHGRHPPELPAFTEGFFLRQHRLGFETLCLGHMHVTSKLLPLMPSEGYGRLLFTASIAAYLVGGTDPITPWVQGYTSAKRALLAYVNSLRGTFAAAQSNIRISTVNPYFVATAGAEHPNPIYTEHVSDNGFTDDPPSPTPFNQFLALIRQRQAAGLPASFVGEAYAQLLAMADPPGNVVVASRAEPYASQGGTEFIEGIALAENSESAIRFSG